MAVKEATIRLTLRSVFVCVEPDCRPPRNSIEPTTSTFANDKVAHHNQLCRKTARAQTGRCQSCRLEKRNNREPGSCCAFGQALVGGEKGPSGGPMLAPRKGRSQL